jgi:DNA-binding CsgD family transcriptional regulator
LQDVHRDEDAIEALEQAAALFHRTASPVSVALARTTIADAKAGLGGQDVGAAADYEAAISILREDAPPQFATQAIVGRALLAEREADSETAIGYLMDAVATIGESESSDAASDLALGATIVFARRHPGEAANAVALVDRSQMPRAYVPDLGRAEATLREHMTASAIRRHAATGRRAGVKSVIDAIERIASVEGPRAQRQLRATYEHLTVREGQVLTLLADGRSDPDIATALGISGKTASVHVANIKAKLGSRSRIEAALTARDLLRARSDGTS